MAKRPKSGSTKWSVTVLAGKALNWCKTHPLPGIVALTAAIVIGLFAIAQGVDWLVGKLDRASPRIVDSDKGAGGNFALTVENPTDVAMVVSQAVFRAEPPAEWQTADMAALTIPAVTYTVPYDCSPGVRRIKLKPAFRVPAKEVGAVVFVSSQPMKNCELYVALETSQGQTKEYEAFSLTEWRRRNP